MTTQTDNRLERAHAFLGKIQGWHETDKGRLAVLRRNAGEPLSQARGTAWLYGYLPQDDRNAAAFFLAATLYAFDRPALEGKPLTVSGNFGASMHRFWLEANESEAEKPNSSAARRFGILLDADYDPDLGGELPFRLRQTVRLVLAKANGQCWINWPQLIHDVRQWNHPDKYVQKQWARAFYAPFVIADGTQPDH